MTLRGQLATAARALTGAVRRPAGWLGAAGTLAAVLALLAGLVRLAWTATPRLASERGARMVWSDYVSAPTGPLYLGGRVVPPVQAQDAPLVVGADTLNHRTLAYSRRGQAMGLRIEGVEVGSVELPIVGTIYSPLAYRRQDVRVVGVPKGRTVWVLDARLADQPDLVDVASMLEPHGTVVAAHLEPGRLEPIRRRVEPLWPGVPVVGDAAGATVRQAMGTFRRRLRRLPTVVTADPATAAQAAAAGADVHLLGGRPPAVGADKVHWHADLAAFKEFLASSPIGQ